MDPKEPDWRKALRAGRSMKEVMAAIYAQRVREWKFDCAHCGRRVPGHGRTYDMRDLLVRVSCAVCGKVSELPMEDFRGLPESQRGGND